MPPRLFSFAFEPLTYWFSDFLLIFIHVLLIDTNNLSLTNNHRWTVHRTIIHVWKKKMSCHNKSPQN